MKMGVKPYHVALPLYLAAAVLIQVDMTVKNSVIVLLPAAVVVVALVKRERWLGIAGFALYAFAVLPLIRLPSILSSRSLLELSFVVIPSILLLSQILSMDTEETVPMGLRPLLPVVLLVFSIGSVLYLVAWLTPLGSAIFYAPQGEVLMLSFLTIVLCTPFLLSSLRR